MRLDRESVPERIREALLEEMKQQGLSYAELADKCNIARENLNRVMTGARMLTPERAKQIAEALKLDLIISYEIKKKQK